MKLANLSRWLGSSRYRADEQYRRALRAFVARDLAAAIDELRAAVELLPGHAEYHAALGFMLLDDKRQREAEASFERALELNPHEMLANYGLGMIAYRSKNWQAAQAFFEAALVPQPKRAETLYYLAMAHHRLGRNQEALGLMREAGSRFAKTAHRREAQCSAWAREFEKLLQPE